MSDLTHLSDKTEAALAALDEIVGPGGKGTVLIRVGRGEDGSLAFHAMARDGSNW